MEQRILDPGKNCRGVYPVRQSRILVDGRNYYKAFFEAARQATQFILLSGWQFERTVPLLRGIDAEGAGDTVMASFLNGLCEANPGLRIFILMWDFSPLVAFDKEWFNKWVLDLTASDRIYFRFDSRHALYASHHQKLVVIDGKAAFVGGLDFSANSWDDRMHWADCAERVLAGEEYEPYHDVQSFVTGPVAWELTRLFQELWVNSGGPGLSLPLPGPGEIEIGKAMPVASAQAAISITRGQTLIPVLEPVMEIRQLYIDAIRKAERLIYIETQYFSSQAVYEAIRQRLADRVRPCPQIVIILPKRFHTVIEDLSLSVVQARMLRALSQSAAEHDAPFGVYYTTALRSEASEKPTYIHSKVMIVDDRFLSVGSANMTNRSMGMDTELNLSWESGSGDSAFVRSVRRVRANLLAEHTGFRRLSERRALGAADGIVEYLNGHAGRAGCRLRLHTMESFLEDMAWMKDLMGEDISIDPERPIIEEGIYEIISRDRNGVFARGVRFINQLVLEAAGAESGDLPGTKPVAGNDRGLLVVILIVSVGLVLGVLAWFIFFTR